MNVTRATLYQLFSRNIRHVVPLFQRPYVWSLDRQWQPLWNDISAKADEFLNYSHNGGNQPTEHFMGAVVLNPLRVVGLQIQAELVIDGQQRLTTLQVVMRALSDVAAQMGHTQMVQNLEFQLTNRGAMEQDYETYKVWPTNADQQIYQDVFKAGSVANLEVKYPQVWKPRRKYPEPRPRLVEAYIYFSQNIEKFVKDREDLEEVPEDQFRQIQLERLNALGHTLMNLMELVKIDLDEKDNPQVIFETLNYRGEPLSPSDLIRNFMFLEVRNQKKSDTALYEQYWLPYDRNDPGGAPNYWKQPEKSGRYLYQRIDLFVYHYLVMQTGRVTSVGRLYQEFSQWWGEEKRDVEAELKQLQDYSEAYRRLLQPDLHTRRGRLALNLRILDYTTTYPLMLFLYETCKDEIPAEELEGIAIDLESYLVRRSVCGLTAKNYNNVFLNILNKLHDQRKNGQVVTRADVQALLLDSRSDTAKWPDDPAFRLAWMEKSVYQSLRNRVRVVLEAIDRDMETKYSETLNVDYSKITIEHFLPQGWQRADYPLPDGEETAVTARRNVLLHTLGNLTLLTQALNTHISNGAFAIKRLEILKHSKLNLNSFLAEASDQWVEEDIRKRGEALFGLALKIWPRPATPN